MPELKLFKRRQVWVPTWQGWLVLCSLPALAIVSFLLLAYPLLNVNQPVGEGYLVAEGWMSKRQISDTVDLFRRGGYEAVLVTGGPIADGSYLRDLYPDFETSAEIGANQFLLSGIERVDAVPRPDVRKDRTYSSALALRKWLTDRGDVGSTLDVVSSGPHARRSWLLFEAALGDVADVGVIALEPSGYDPRRWWTTSSGVRSMIGELLAYGYAKLLFYPNPERDLKTLYSEGNSL